MIRCGCSWDWRAPTVDARVRPGNGRVGGTGAFDSQGVLCLASPTGTGYVNYVVAETLEYLTEGDCATVALQYSLRPSFCRWTGWHWGGSRIEPCCTRSTAGCVRFRRIVAPDLSASGESGSVHAGMPSCTRARRGLHRAGMTRALFIGTPAESKWAEQWRLGIRAVGIPDGEVVEVASEEEWLALPEQERAAARYLLLSHHGTRSPNSVGDRCAGAGMDVER